MLPAIEDREASTQQSDHTAMSDIIPNSHKVLVLGASGVGKSSLIKALTGNPTVKTSCGVDPCTVKTTSYNVKHNEHYVFYDTVGLTKKMPAEQAAPQLIDFMCHFRAGLNLIVLVMRRGRLSEHDEACYELAKRLGRDIPIVLVVTHCDNEAKKEKWLNQSTPELKKKMRLADIIGVNVEDNTDLDSKSPDTDSVTNQLKEQALRESWSLIERHSSTRHQLGNTQPGDTQPAASELGDTQPVASEPRNSNRLFNGIRTAFWRIWNWLVNNGYVDLLLDIYIAKLINLQELKFICKIWSHLKRLRADYSPQANETGSSISDP